MPRLIELTQFRRELHGFGLTPSWYFPDAKFLGKGHSNTYYWDYTIVSGYPAVLYIHFRNLGTDHRRTSDLLTDMAKRTTIRRWVERCLDGDVIHSIDDRTYEIETATRIIHGYHLFHFESEAEANHFLLRFADLVELPTEYNERDIATQEWLQQPTRGPVYFLYR